LLYNGIEQIKNKNIVFGIKQGGIVTKTIDGGATWKIYKQ